MRDPKRISNVLSAVEALWRQYPDWRLGQLMANIADWAEKPIWDLEENEVLEEIERFQKRQQAQHETETSAESQKR